MPLNYVSPAVDLLYSAGKAVSACENRAIARQRGRMHGMQLAKQLAAALTQTGFISAICFAILPRIRLYVSSFCCVVAMYEQHGTTVNSRLSTNFC